MMHQTVHIDDDDEFLFVTNKFKKILKKHVYYNGRKFKHKNHKEKIVSYEYEKPKH